VSPLGKGDAVTVAAARLAEVFVEVADSGGGDPDLSEFLQLVTARVAEVVQSDAAGMLLADTGGRLQFVAGSDETTTMLELFQVQHDEGPCLDCFRSGEPVDSADLARAVDRWPRFAPLALAAGFHAVHAVPMQRDHTGPVGAMSLFQTSTGGLQPDDIKIVQSLADVATIKLVQERALRGAEVLADQLQRALASRIVIEQAKGVLAQFHRISVEAAFTLMRDHARRSRRRLSDVAQELINDPTSVRG
jgi:GAF domain-containing protein